MRTFLLAMLLWFGTPAQEPPQANQNVGAFALPDPKGERLIVMSELAQPESFTTALCAGQSLPIRFVRRQKARDDSTGRQTSESFDELSGDIFEVVRLPVAPDEPCFVAADSWVAEGVVSDPSHGGPGTPRLAGCGDRGRFERVRGRHVVQCRVLHGSDAGLEVMVLEFARMGKNALASVALVDGARILFGDYSAEFKGEGQDLWRADDGGKLQTEDFSVVGVVKRANGYAVAISWRGAEGDALSLWVSDTGDRFEEVIRDSWYQAPM
jgi:hypothetical protein